MESKRALILHGTSATPDSNWFGWLKLELEKKGYEVWLPLLPQADHPNMRRYTDFLLANSDFFTADEIILIGHSSGAVAILGLLQQLSSKVHISSAYLVGSFKDDLGWDSLKELFLEPFDFATIKQRCDHFVFIHSDNDPHCPLAGAQYLCEQLGGELVILPRQGHFNTAMSQQYQTFPKLLELIIHPDSDLAAKVS